MPSSRHLAQLPAQLGLSSIPNAATSASRVRAGEGNAAQDSEELPPGQSVAVPVSVSQHEHVPAQAWPVSPAVYTHDDYDYAPVADLSLQKAEVDGLDWVDRALADLQATQRPYINP